MTKSNHGRGRLAEISELLKDFDLEEVSNLEKSRQQQQDKITDLEAKINQMKGRIEQMEKEIARSDEEIKKNKLLRRKQDTYKIA